MSQRRLSMRKIRELPRLKYELGGSHREIAALLGIANSTGERLRAARECGRLLMAVGRSVGRRHV